MHRVRGLGDGYSREQQLTAVVYLYRRGGRRLPRASGAYSLSRLDRHTLCAGLTR